MAYDYFCCYHNYYEKVANLSDQEVGRLFRALMKYSQTGEKQELAGRESVAYDFIVVDIDIAKEKYDEKCKKNQENAKSVSSNHKQPPATATERKRPPATAPKEKEEIKEKKYLALSDDKAVSNPDGFDRCTSEQIQRIIDAWNSLGLQTIQRIAPNSTRIKLLRTRIREYGVEKVLEAIERIRGSTFLQGEKGWVITFDWFIKPNNFPKVLEGNYDGRKQAEASQGRKTPYGSAGQGPLGELEQEALARMLEKTKEGGAT